PISHHTASPGSTIVGRPCAAFGGMPFGRPSGGREVGRRSGISRRSSLSLDREINAYPIGYRIEPHTPVRTSGSVSSRSRAGAGAGAGALDGVPASHAGRGLLERGTQRGRRLLLFLVGRSLCNANSAPGSRGRGMERDLLPS